MVSHKDGNPRKSAASRDPDEEAIGWTIALQDNLGDPLLNDRFRAWLQADPANARAWDEIAHVHDRLGQLQPAFAVPPAPMPRHAPRAGRRLPPPRRIAASATMAAMALGVAMLTVPTIALHLRADHMTAVGEVREIALDDGSLVQLAPRSAISVDYARGRRDVTLLRGEAFFDVARNPGRPFHVKADRMTVTVLGTAFDVRDADGSGRTAFVGVEHGRVRVASLGAGRKADVITAGESLSVAGSGALARGTVPPSQVAAWRQRQLIVNDMPATEAIDRLRPWYGGMIVTRGDGLTKQRLTGVFDAANPLEALHGMARAYGGRVTSIGSWLIIYSQD